MPPAPVPAVGITPPAMPRDGARLTHSAWPEKKSGTGICCQNAGPGVSAPHLTGATFAMRLAAKPTARGDAGDMTRSSQRETLPGPVSGTDSALAERDGQNPGHLFRDTRAPERARVGSETVPMRWTCRVERTSQGRSICNMLLLFEVLAARVCEQGFSPCSLPNQLQRATGERLSALDAAADTAAVTAILRDAGNAADPAKVAQVAARYAREEIEPSPGGGAQLERKPDRQVAEWGAEFETVKRAEPGTVREAGPEKARPGPRSEVARTRSRPGERAGRDGYGSRHGNVMIRGRTRESEGRRRDAPPFPEIAEIDRKPLLSKPCGLAISPHSALEHRSAGQRPVNGTVRAAAPRP